jgi:ParB-like chromosome segregation protein Spo0J
MISTRLELVKIEQLREHEEIDPSRLREMYRLIEADGVLKRPLAVDFRTLAVLDGVHRLNILKQRQCKKVPVYLVDYLSDEIVVYSTDRRTIISKDDVINAALSGRKFPPRTTWHMIKMADGSLEHISWIEKEVHFALDALVTESEH